jgi:Uma2 family endonuclease
MVAVMTHTVAKPFTYADLEAMPDDGYRHEIIDGMLFVSPSPVTVHQRAVGRIYRLLDDARPPDLEVFVAPYDVVLANDTVIEPDVVVARKADLTDRNLPAPPVLAVEVLSFSTRNVDLLLKRERLQRAGCRHYWIIDPDEPSLMVLDLKDGVYQQAGFVTADETYRATLPYAVSVVPANLVSA